jgi:FMN reductase
MSTERFRLVLVSAGTSDPSSTRLLADRAADRVKALAARRGHEVTVGVIELREISAEISTALVSQLVTPKLRQAITALAEADGIIAAAPVYKAGPSGLFTSFFDVLDNDLLIGKPVVLAATAGTARHALVADEAMRPMESGFAGKIKDESWQSYQHEYGSAGGTETGIDLDSDMMRLATGGSAT